MPSVNSAKVAILKCQISTKLHQTYGNNTRKKLFSFLVFGVCIVILSMTQNFCVILFINNPSNQLNRVKTFFWHFSLISHLCCFMFLLLTFFEQMKKKPNHNFVKHDTSMCTAIKDLILNPFSSCLKSLKKDKTSPKYWVLLQVEKPQIKIKYTHKYNSITSVYTSQCAIFAFFSNFA